MSTRAKARPEVSPAWDEWITCKEAAAISGLTLRQLRKLSRGGFLKYRIVPGTKTRYSRPSLERLLERSMFPERGWDGPSAT
jgi:hypothetical protein